MGQEHIKSHTLVGTRHTKAFCLICGSALPSLQLDGTLLAVPAGALDTTVTLRPNAHLFFSSRANWDQDLEHVKKFDQLPK